MIDENILKHINTHTEKSAEDFAAVKTLEFFLRSNGKINTNFSYNDKWPNSDGTFELVSNPDNSRIPEQNFFVQIKGTHYLKESEGVMSYSLQSLAFPASICAMTTFDPGILFVVSNPDERGEERIFWKYMSSEFVHSIDYAKKSCTVKFTCDDEIKNTDESIDEFCNRLVKIIEDHKFSLQLDKRIYSKNEIERMVRECNKDITDSINHLEIYNATRDNISKEMLKSLNRFCVAVLLLNTLQSGTEKINIQLAWERSLLKSDTKYLGKFYKALEYIGYYIPEEGQSERLMLKYYDFLWQIRNTLQTYHGISVLENLEKFPLSINKVDKEYYEMVAMAIENLKIEHYLPESSRFYVHKKTSFYIGKERYYEVTLQLAGIYATKYNRITAYTKKDITTNYSIQIEYSNVDINLWEIHSKIKVITNWRVSIDSVCLNKLSKILHNSLKLNSNYREYRSLMNFLTETGMNLLELIDLKEIEFEQILKDIYADSNTFLFRDILLKLRNEYAEASEKKGKNIVRYLLLNLREELIENVIANEKALTDDLYVDKRCYPFDKNPFISNLPGSRTGEKSRRKNILKIETKKNLDVVFPYLKVYDRTMQTGEIYFKNNTIVDDSEIKKYNRTLDSWEIKKGYTLNQDDKYTCIDSYERNTLVILKKLLEMSKRKNSEQHTLNQKFIKENEKIFSDNLKKQALKNAFINSGILLIYGAAGTGKTTLINYISDMFYGKQKLFLAKTHTALKNLKRRIDDSESNSDFSTIDSFVKKKKTKLYDIIFIDECSVIDNRIMREFIDKVSEETHLVLAGDIYQIEAIDFGNWFFYAKDIIKIRGSNVELMNTWRTKDKKLIGLWDEVRKREFMIAEKLVIDGPFSAEIGPDILQTEEADEVVLCLNYDGKFGLNNMNNYFQSANKKGEAITWGEWNYKKGDPILFNDSKRFPILYNNLKGKIIEVWKIPRQEINFVIDVYTVLTEEECRKYDIKFISCDGKNTRIQFGVFRYDASDLEKNTEEIKMKAVVPFQLAYAVSIHKAQGLEYESVKIVIPESNSEKITHGIFYTAITRAKKKLKIYWSSETMKKVIDGFSGEVSRKESLEIIKKKLGVSC